MPASGSDDLARLRNEVDSGLREQLAPDELLPLLARLARLAPAESEDWVHAHRHLAELGVEREPWRAAIFARRVINLRPDDDGAWAVLGLSQSLLANYRFAAHAYRRALRLAPDNPFYAHNLGHLYDVALGRAADALPLLARAMASTHAANNRSDIAASYAHALARCGQVEDARHVLARVIHRHATPEQAALMRWIDAGAPASGTVAATTADRKRPKRRRPREQLQD